MPNKKFENTDEIFNSIEGIQHVPAPGFFYTRLKARMENETTVSGSKKRILQPVLIISGLVALLLINAMILFQNDGNKSVVTERNNDNIQIVSAEYRINDILAEEINQ